MPRFLTPSFAVALTALVAALGGTAVAAGQLGDTPETMLQLRVAKDGKLIGSDNDGTVKKAGVGLYDITFTAGPTGSKVPLDLERCAITATPRIETLFRRRRSPPTSTSSASAGRASASSPRACCRSARTRSRLSDQRELRRDRGVLI